MHHGDPLSLGIDVGGTKTHGIVLDADNRVVAELIRPSQTRLSGVRGTILSVSHSLADQIGRSESSFTSVGVGIPGIVDPRTGRIATAVNLGINDANLREVLEEDFCVAVRIENDVKATALGVWFTLRDSARDICYVNLGTGLSAAAVANGHLIRGARNGAGEIGHFAAHLDPDLCACGQMGCLEVSVGGSHVNARLAAQGLELHKLAADPSTAARREVRRLSRAVATTITLVAICYDSERIVVGGGLVRAASWLIPAVTERLREQAETSRFLAGLDAVERLLPLAESVSAPALGAALIGRMEEVGPAGLEPTTPAV